MTDDLARVLADIDTLLPPGAPTTPAGACEPWEAEAMRWSPVDHDDHPAVPAPPEPGDDDYVSDWQVAFAAFERERDAACDADRGSTGTPFARGRRMPPPDVLRYALGDWIADRTPPVGQGTPDRVGMLIERAGWYHLGWSEDVMQAAIQATGDAYRAHLESLRGQAQHTTRNLQHLRNRHQQAQAVINARRHRNTGPQNPAGIDGRARRHQHPTKAPADNARPATHATATPIVWMREQDGAPVVVSFIRSGVAMTWDVGL